jgi:hypothetical protein
MNVEIGAEAPIFLFWECLFRNFGILSLQCTGERVYKLAMVTFYRTFHHDGEGTLRTAKKFSRKNVISPICFHINREGNGRDDILSEEHFENSKPVAKFLVPDWGDIVGSGIGLSYRPSRLHRLAGQCNNPLAESTKSPSQGLGIGPLERYLF